MEWKTTSIGKIEKLKENNSKVLFSACDTFRAAADQLEQWANKINVGIIKSDPAQIPPLLPINH